MNERAVALALQALYNELSEQQQTHLNIVMMRDARKHDLEHKDEDEAMELLRGY